ncbi:expressed unknown protein [Seminavis robusta]|uniref:Uncharacterized protein n=1 Tax=Seminavis robusta TaxID=568900 RepID=A0A9N8EK44_9STRA|nr:expressed unknown protein [Seminavis robusta]|eukprot:Sro1206_g252360.1 n/a (757) ;mRNA; f:15102-17372
MQAWDGAWNLAMIVWLVAVAYQVLKFLHRRFFPSATDGHSDYFKCHGRLSDRPPVGEGESSHYVMVGRHEYMRLAARDDMDEQRWFDQMMIQGREGPPHLRRRRRRLSYDRRDDDDLIDLMHRQHRMDVISPRDRAAERRANEPVKRNPQAWTLDDHQLSLDDRNNLSDWTLKQAQTLADFCLNPSNSLQHVNLQACQPMKEEVLAAVLQALGKMNRLNRLHLECTNDWTLTQLTQHVLHVPALSVTSRRTIAPAEADAFAIGWNQERVLPKRELNFHNLNDESVANLFTALKHHPIENVGKLQARSLQIGGVKAMSKYLERMEGNNSNCELILCGNCWPNGMLRHLVNSLLAPTNKITRLQFRNASFPQETRRMLSNLLQNKTNLEALSFYRLNSHEGNRWNEAVVKGLYMSAPKLTRSLTTLEVVHALRQGQVSTGLAYNWSVTLPMLIKQHPHWKVLNLNDNFNCLNDLTLEHFTQALPTSTQLERLNISNASISAGKVHTVVQSLPTNVLMTYLDLSHLQISRETSKDLGRWLSSQYEMQELVLDACKLDATGVESILCGLVQSQCSLKKLNFAGCCALGLQGFNLLIEYIPLLPKSFRSLTLTNVPESRHGIIEMVPPEVDRRLFWRATRLMMKLKQVLRENTNLLQISVELQPKFPPGFAEYLERRNHFIQSFLRDADRPPWETMMDNLNRSLVRGWSELQEPSMTTITAGMVLRALRSVQPKGAQGQDWELSLWYDAFSLGLIPLPRAE